MAYNKESRKEYYLKNKEHEKQCSREYYLKNKEHLLKQKAVYRFENKEKIALTEFKYINTERGYVLEVIGGIFQRYKKKDNRK